MTPYLPPPALRGPLAKGLIFGGAAAVGWAVARRYGGQDQDPRLIDWEWATRIAARAAGVDGAIERSERPRLQREYESMVREIERPIANYTGTQLPLGQTQVLVLDRVEWIKANVANFKQLFQPIEEMYQATLRRGGRCSPACPRSAGRRCPDR